MARNPVTPVMRIDAVGAGRIGERGPTYFTQLEQWRIYSRIYADERRQREQHVAGNTFEQTLAESEKSRG